MRCILAATSSVLSAAAAAEFGPIGTVWNRPGVVCRLVPWSQISDPLLDSTLLPLQLSAYTPVCLSGLSVLPNLSVCHFSGHFCSSVVISVRPLCLHICLPAFIFLLFFCLSSQYRLSVCLSLICCLHLADEDVNMSFHWRWLIWQVSNFN